METIKTAVVVVLLLAVLYGVYVVLNKPELAPPPEAAGWNADAAVPPEIQTGVPTPLDGLRPVPVDQQAPQGGQPTLASAVPADPTDLARNVPQGAVTNISDLNPMEAGAVTPTPASPSLAIPSQSTAAAGPAATTLASASMTAAAAAPTADTASGGAEAVSASNPSSSTVTADAAKPQESIYAQSANLAPQDQPGSQSVRAFDSAWTSALELLQKGRWSDALLTLSFFFHDPEITGEERQRLLDLLDPLAGKVIYSNEHTLEAAYEVKPGERLDAIAQQLQVPVSLLQNINGIANPDELQPGTQLKVVRGPFRAEIDLKRSEMVLFLDRYYAGRFAISAGNDPAPQPSEYVVKAKESGHEYTGPNGIRIPAGAADNPYGSYYLDLGNRVSIHGSPDTLPAGGLGCLSLSTADVADVYGILSIGSKVTIR